MLLNLDFAVKQVKVTIKLYAPGKAHRIKVCRGARDIESKDLIENYGLTRSSTCEDYQKKYSVWAKLRFWHPLKGPCQ
jgi:hypothetical protein